MNLDEIIEGLDPEAYIVESEEPKIPKETLDSILSPEILMYVAYRLYEANEVVDVRYYYVNEFQVEEYLFTPDWIEVVRAPKEELGNGVLGVAYPSANLVKVLDTLYGRDLVEVKKHEILHIMFPYQTEPWIRMRTMQETEFPTRYQ